MFDEAKKAKSASNVVSLAASAAGKRQGSTPSLARLPAPVHRVREKVTVLLQKTLTALFDSADDALFDLADKAVSNQDQNTYFEAMRVVRLQRRTIEQNFFTRMDKAFAVLLLAVPEDSSGFASHMSLDDLALVDNEQLEFQVAVESMIAKVLDRCAESAQHIALRLDSLVPAKVYQQNNPVGPDVLCNTFWKVIEPLDVDIKAKLVLLKLFDKAVMAQLGKIYTVLNNVLIQQNVLPSLTSRDVHRHRVGSTPASQAAAPTRTAQSAPPQEQDPVLQQLRALLTPAAGVRAGSEQGAVSPVAGAQSNGNDVAAGAAVSAGELARVLTSLQQVQASSAAAYSVGAVQPELMNTQQLTQQLNQSLPMMGGQPKSLSAVDQDVMNLVNMLFQFILDDRNLPAPMQALLSRLQIPLLKVAVIDKSFFNRAGHPARRLLNELATAALGWQQPEQHMEKDPLFRKVTAVVETIISDFEDDVSLFEAQLTDFLSFIEKERRRATVLEKRTLDAEDGKAKSEFARAQVNDKLQAILGGRVVAECVTDILEGPWHNVMFLTLLKHGPESDEWLQVGKVVEDLVWSVTVSMDAEARQQLMKLLPTLLKQLRQGFEEISFSPFEMNKLLKQLEAEHLRQMRAPQRQSPQGQEPPQGKAQAPQRQSVDTITDTETITDTKDALTHEPRAASTPVLHESAQQMEQTQSLDGDLSDEFKSQADTGAHQPHSAWMEQVARFSVGSWFEVLESGQPTYRCRLAAVIKQVDKYIFVNRTGMKVAEKTRTELASALEAGAFNVLDDGMLFDRALESVIGNLRKERGRSV